MIDGYSTRVFLARLCRSGRVIAQGTAFTWKSDSQLYLVTALHLVSGLEPSKEHVGGSAGRTMLWQEIPDEISVTLANGGIATYSLVDADDRGLWFEHPRFGSNVDVAVLPVEEPESLSPTLPPMNGPAVDERMFVWIGSEVFVLGYPFGMEPTGNFPVWKRASVATEPRINIEGLPKFLIDTATRGGMSGSPVLLRTCGYYFSREAYPVSTPELLTRFLGIYTGRIAEIVEAGGDRVRAAQREIVEELRAQLGIVWKANVIDEIIAGGQRATG